jgi:hypothetical protein
MEYRYFVLIICVIFLSHLIPSDYFVKMEYKGLGTYRNFFLESAVCSQQNILLAYDYENRERHQKPSFSNRWLWSVGLLIAIYACLLTLPSFYPRVIDQRKYIFMLQTMVLHGSRYKDTCLIFE